jgi:dienelactone hydrolase
LKPKACFLSITLVTVIWGMPVSAADVDYDRVSFASVESSRTPITGLIFRPKGSGPFGAVVGMHGCNGLFEADGVAVAHYVSWARQLRDAGYIVLLVDSLGSRGIASLCGSRRPSPVRADDLSGDAYGALLYLQQRMDVRPNAIAILGWSMGGDVVLKTISAASPIRPAALPIDFSAAIAFYPGGCSLLAREGNWVSAVPLLLQLGAADNYTPPQPCVGLLENVRGRGAAVDINLYRDAYHLFDHPDMVPHPFTGIVYRDGSSPMIGTNAIARAAAIARVKDFLQQHLKLAR